MSTRWIVPCGCELVYDIEDDDIVLTHNFKPCISHKNVKIENAHDVAIKYCKQLQGAEID
jgi:hypothetical protein